ncbi:protein nessun dorma [Tribolium castaneum]|uniref:SHC SH2 domain-binding protein 1-like Protein n=1 Tax=Tribolium castaneum TaxID=7070 RepID=D6WKG0_TRICA|nr:PREDICTED: SHC SH2 domain-binding protein 1 [Tribolium castaneum]EFA03585.1 SHC SH2 domain-binding protein 1-like Protein [Tribolium castaneum]|eukprot:XP_972789.1 PREDICTED: SHC SH2 domain-binding protein 1 [Tribolium castaneum]
MDQVITFDKSLQQRLQEYNEVLGGYEVLPASAIANEWGFYLDLTLDPNGWQAVWKIQRKTCEALNIAFPTVVLVFVLDVSFKEMTALVKVLAVQDDIHIPEKHWVPLIQLWPTKAQDKSVAINLHSTANVLDMLRFFYHNLVMPWDFEEDDEGDWKSKHLEPRLRLYYDLKNGVIPRVTAERLHSLMSEAKRLEQKREQLESELDDLESCDGDNAAVNDPTVEQLSELHIRLMEIKGEMDILENPMLRKVVIKKQKEMVPAHDDTKQNIWVIQAENTLDDSIEFLQKIKASYPTEIVRFSPQLSSTLDYANPNDVFIVKEGKHMITVTGALEHGGLLKGVSATENTILSSKTEDVMLDFRGGNVVIENMTIDASSPQCGIIVRGGQLTLINCRIYGDGKSSTHQGILILNGANLQTINCEISHFSTAIVGNSGSNVTMESTEIHNCNLGLKIYDNCCVKATKVAIQNCKEYGICVETENNIDDSHQKVGDFDTLNIIPQLQMEFISGDNNAKGDAVINQKSKLKPIENLFENPDSDPTICVDSDEEMDTLQTTVIENNCDGRSSPATI